MTLTPTACSVLLLYAMLTYFSLLRLVSEWGILHCLGGWVNYLIAHMFRDNQGPKNSQSTLDIHILLLLGCQRWPGAACIEACLIVWLYDTYGKWSPCHQPGPTAAFPISKRLVQRALLLFPGATGKSVWNHML